MISKQHDGATLPEVAPPPANDSMRRIQIGLAGVLAVMLLVGLAGLIGDRAREEAADGMVPAGQGKLSGDADDSGAAPLEELGVQPVTDDAAAPAARAPASKMAPLASTSKVPDLEPNPELERARQSAP